MPAGIGVPCTWRRGPVQFIHLTDSEFQEGYGCWKRREARDRVLPGLRSVEQ
jgi:hypothetical protein